MEKIFYAIMATVAMPACVFAQQTESENEKPVDLYFKGSNAPTIKRDIFLIPTVTIDGRTLRFYNQFENDVTISIVVNEGNTDNPTVIYTSVKEPEESQLTIPNTITGNYIIYIETEDATFWGEITVE